MKILVTGVGGQLGFDLHKELINQGENDVFGIDKSTLDITDKNAVDILMKKIKPNIIIHCAAYTNVEGAEVERDLCLKVNVEGTKNLINQAIKYDSKFLYISTDYIFDGLKKTPYKETDKPNPTSIYGLSKYFGELETKKIKKHYIARISWVFGKNGNNFVKTMIGLSKLKKDINVVSDQFGSPTYTYDLSKVLLDIIKTEKYGTYNVTNEGYCSWYELAEEIFRILDISKKLNPIKSTQYQTKAKRPNNSKLNKEKLYINGFKRLPHWKDALKRYLREIEVI